VTVAIPIVYNLRSLRQRWTSALVAVLGVAGAVGVFVAMLAMARGFRATMISSGSADNALVRRAGASSEMESALAIDAVRLIEGAPGVARGDGQPLVSAEVVVIAAFPLRSTGTDANVQVRGVGSRTLGVRRAARVVEGRFFTPGLTELVVGRNAARTYAGLELGASVRLGGSTWTVVGIHDSGGTAFDSEVWCDASVLNQTYQRPEGVFQSVTARLESAGAFAAFKDALTADPRLQVQVDREVDYYRKQSGLLSEMISVVGGLVALVMAVGAVVAALNTMYAAVAERGREIAVMRAFGFGGGAVVASFVVEALLVALAGGALGSLLVLPVNGLTVGTINWQTFSHLAFAFRITPDLIAYGLVFALAMGLAGGLPPALRAARRPVAPALREL
jgi:putative ABC transport system permease protein